MNFINRMRTRVTQYHLNIDKLHLVLNGSWRIRIERRFLDETDKKGYWLFRLTGGFHCHVYFQTEQNTLEDCFRASVHTSDGFPETDMEWLSEIAGFISNFEDSGSKLTILQFGNGNGQVLNLTAKFKDRTTYEYRVRLSQDGEPIFERLWGKLIEKLAEDTRSLTLDL